MTTPEDRDLWERDEEALRTPAPVDPMRSEAAVYDDEVRVQRYFFELLAEYESDHEDWGERVARRVIALADEEHATLVAEVERLRAGEAGDPGDPAVVPTPAEWLRRFNDAEPERRLSVAELAIANSDAVHVMRRRAAGRGRCVMGASEKAVAAVMETLGCAYGETAAGLFCITHHCYADQRDSDLDECDFAGRVADLAVDTDRASIQAQALREAAGVFDRLGGRLTCVGVALRLKDLADRLEPQP